ncbi:MAG: hypothetical protein Q7R39_19120 [Dehalococcoidia bacterium]|nr:hypothetical protein [Dehalococcoidia bacterium]
MTVVMVVGFAWAVGLTATATVGLAAAGAVGEGAGAACVGAATAGALVGAGVGADAGEQDAAIKVNKSIDPIIQTIAFPYDFISRPPSSASPSYLVGAHLLYSVVSAQATTEFQAVRCGRDQLRLTGQPSPQHPGCAIHLKLGQFHD